MLARMYGKSPYYKPAQVKEAAKAANLPLGDLCYGLSVYCTSDDFAEYHTASDEKCSYWEMRVEVAEHHFHGNLSFSQQDVAAHPALFQEYGVYGGLRPGVTGGTQALANYWARSFIAVTGPQIRRPR